MNEIPSVLTAELAAANPRLKQGIARRQISHERHDEIGQSLAGVSVTLEVDDGGASSRPRTASWRAEFARHAQATRVMEIHDHGTSFRVRRVLLAYRNKRLGPGGDSVHEKQGGRG